MTASDLSQSAAQTQRANDLIRQLGEFRAALPAGGSSDGRPEPSEVRRNQVYDDLRALGDALVPAIGQGLTDPDVQVRRNVALFLNAEGSSYSSFWGRPRLDIRPYLPALAAALADADSRVRGLSAHAIGLIGPEARSAVPVLITLLANPNEGSRGSACIALVGIGPPARAALPALRKALSDSSLNVRFQALRAIGSVNALH